MLIEECSRSVLRLRVFELHSASPFRTELNRICERLFHIAEVEQSTHQDQDRNAN